MSASESANSPVARLREAGGLIADAADDLPDDHHFQHDLSSAASLVSIVADTLEEA